MWKPLNVENKERADQVLNSIADTLYSYDFNQVGIGLMGGKAGIALFMYYYYRYTNNEKYLDKANEYIESDFEQINNGFSFGTHAGGISGILYALSIIKEEGFVDIDKELFQEFDTYLSDSITNCFKNNNYDFLHGALGYGIFFLRYPELYIDNLEKAFDNLKDMATDFKENGVAWHSVNSHANFEGYNLSLSHGLSSIIHFLAKLYEHDICKDRVYNLLKEAVKYLFYNLQPVDEIGSYFPAWSDPGVYEWSRMAWCYGDMGIAASLWQVGYITGNDEWREKAEEVLLFSANRRDVMKELVRDAGLCHGSAGLALMFHRMYNYTQRIEFKETAEYWVDVTFKFSNSEDGVAGFKAYRPANSEGNTKETGMLEGVAGVGLSLISAMSEIEPKWDATLLLS
jgi:lantibiotic modifying enzyme